MLLSEYQHYSGERSRQSSKLMLEIEPKVQRQTLTMIEYLSVDVLSVMPRYLSAFLFLAASCWRVCHGPARRQKDP